MKLAREIGMVLGLGLGGTAAWGAVTASLVLSRTSGVAPLSVFFDATGTTSDATSRPFHDVDYTWDFGDANAGAWVLDGLPKDRAKGPLAGHVFESPGTYTVTLTVRDDAGGTDTEQVSITVQNPDTVFSGANTICFSNQGNFDGCPSGASRVTMAAGQFASLGSHVATGRRLLLRRGEQWTASGGVRINVPGPGIVGAFGDGAKPRVTAAGNIGLIVVSGRVPSQTDWRVMDLDLQGNNFPDSMGVQGDGMTIDFLALRVDIAQTHNGFSFSPNILDYWNQNGFPGHDFNRNLSVVDSTVTHLIGADGGNGGYIGVRNFLWLGNYIVDTTEAEHGLRTPFIGKGVIGHSYFSDQGPPRHLIKMHAPDWDQPGIGFHLRTEWVVLSDNEFQGSEESDWSVGLGPRDEGGDHRVWNVVVERNLFRGGRDTQYHLLVWASEVTVRNNLFLYNTVTGTGGRGCIFVGPRGIAPPPVEVRVYHNSAFSSETEAFTFVSVAAASANTTVRNNLASAPVAGSRTMVGANGDTSDLFQSHNLLTNTPGFLSASPGQAGDFRLTAGSPAVNAGTLVGTVFEDFAGDPRLSGPAPDLGAFEFGAGGPPDTTSPAAPRGLALR